MLFIAGNRLFGYSDGRSRKIGGAEKMTINKDKANSFIISFPLIPLLLFLAFYVFYSKAYHEDRDLILVVFDDIFL